MPPKKTDAEQTADQLQQQMGRITLLEQSLTKVDTMEQTLSTMQQQMSAFFGRWEQERDEQLKEQARSLEVAKGKAQQVEETPVGEELTPGTKETGQIPTSKPTLTPEEGSERKGSCSQGSDHTEGYRCGKDREKSLTDQMELPLFDGEQADSWVLRAEQYFELSEFTEEQKLKAVRMCFVEDALLWYRWERDRDPFRSWNHMKERVLEQYSSMKDTSAGERLLRLRQEGTVKEFCREFIALATNAPEVTDAMLKMAFMSGLKSKIRNGVRMFEVTTLQKMMKVARKVEAWEDDDDEESKPYGSSTGRNSKPNNGGTSTFLNRANSNGPGLQKSKPNYNQSPMVKKDKGDAGKTTTYHNRVKAPFRRLTPAEIEQRRAAGLCFRCDEKYHRNHKCPKPELTVLVMYDDGSEEVFEEEPRETEEEDEVEAVVAEVSMNSVVGLSSSRTMKLRGELGGETVIVLIDSGASHNFVSERMATKLGLVAQNTTKYGVMVAGGVKVHGRGIITGVELKLQDCTIHTSFLPLELGIADVILGVQWLDTLGETRNNWKLQRMKIKLEGEWVVLQGDPSLHSAAVSLKSIWRTMKREGEGMVIEFGGLQASAADTSVTTEPEWQDVTEQYTDVFQEPRGLPPSRGKEHAIVLETGASPVSVRPFRYPQAQKTEIERQIGTMLAAGIIKESSSPFSSPVLLVKKKDGSWRFCVDYRALNRVTVADKYPIPMIDQLLDELHGATIFSKLDLRSGYHQILVKAEDVPKTAFRTHDGHYEFLVMPFGLSNAPATFQSLMNDVFRPHLRRFVLVFFDDILVYSKTKEEHKRHLEVVLQLLRENQLYANQKKCQFGSVKVEYLGHIISAHGVAADPEKVKAMMEWPEPKTIKGLRGFLGLTGYYRKFVLGYGSIARPLTSLLQKDQFRWCEEATGAFVQLKEAMATAPVLAMPDFGALFIVESDASGVGLGAVLMQGQRPIAYFSQALTARQKLKSVYERELMAIVFAVQKWRHYLLGRRFLVRTDQKSLKFLLEQREINMEYQKWLTKLLGFEFDITYKPGLENKAADALSRKAEVAELYAVTVATALQLEEISGAVDNDEELQKLITELQEDPAKHPDYSWVQGRLLRQGKLVIPKDSPLVKVILHEHHDSKMAGHGGMLKTQKRIGGLFYWRGMMTDIRRYVAACQTCQRQKYSTLAPGGLLQPLPVPGQVWEDISMDFVEGLPKSEGYNSVMVVVDRFTKYAHFIKLKHPYTAPEIAQVFVHEVIKLHGFPRTIISDRDKVFTSLFWKELFKLSGSKLCFSTAYHPQTDGQTEVTNRSMETYLRCYAGDKPKTWAKYLDWAELSYNTSHHSTLQMSPFQALYGREPPALLKYEEGSTVNAALEEQLRERDRMLEVIKEQLHRSQQLMKQRADVHRREVEFEVGDMVLVKLRPYRQRSLAKRINEKLSARFYGPFEVLAKVGRVAYKLKLPDDAKIHPTFHVSQLKKIVGEAVETVAIPPQMTVEGVLEMEPAKVMQKRKNVNTGEEEVMIKWKGLPAHDCTWEEVTVMRNQFPDFDLEDKVNFEEAGIDTYETQRPPIIFTYKRRGQAKEIKA